MSVSINPVSDGFSVASTSWSWVKGVTGIAENIMVLAGELLGNTAQRHPFIERGIRSGVKVCSYNPIISIPFDLVQSGLDTSDLVDKRRRGDIEGALFSLASVGLTVTDTAYNGLLLLASNGIVDKATPILTVGTPLSIGLTAGNLFLTSVKSVQTLMLWNRLKNTNPTLAKDTLLDLLGTEEEKWKEGKLERRTSEKGVNAIKELRSALEDEDLGKANGVLNDLKSLCKRKLLMNAATLISGLLTLTALVMFLIGTPLFPPLPFILLGIAAIIGFGVMIYDWGFLEKNLFTESSDRIELKDNIGYYNPHGKTIPP